MSKSAPRLSVELLEDRAVPSATPQVDVSVTNTGQGVVTSGSLVTFTVVVSNSGPDAADGTYFTDQVPENLENMTWTSSSSTGVTGSSGGNAPFISLVGFNGITDVINLPANSSITYLVQGTFDTFGGQSVLSTTATAKVASSVIDTNPNNNTATATDTTLGTPGTPVDITVTATPQQQSYATIDGNAAFTVVIANNGTTAVNGIAVGVPLSSFTYSLTELHPPAATWTSVENGGASGSAGSGTGDVSELVNLPAGASITYTVTVPFDFIGLMPQSGTPVTAHAYVGLPQGFVFASTNSHSVQETAESTVFAAGVTAPSPPPGAPRPFSVSADGRGVVVYNTDGSVRFTLDPFPGFNGAMKVATGDVNGDGIPDIVVGAKLPDSAYGQIAVFNGVTGQLITKFQTATPFQGGVNVAIGDVLADGYGDIILGSASGVPHVEVFSLATGTPVLRDNFLAYTGFNGGVSVAAADLFGSGIDYLIAGVASGGPANVYVYYVAQPGPSKSLVYKFTYHPGYTGGVNVAAGNFGGTVDDILVAPNSAGTGDQVQVYGMQYDVRQYLPTLIDTIIPQISGPRLGVQVGVGAVPGDNQNSILIAPDHDGVVQAYHFPTDVEVDSFSPFSDYNGAIYVG